jgi:GPH family glycoside/pentoside/hexuronide:cation symporter
MASLVGSGARARLSPWTLICYAAPGVPAAMALYAVGVIVPGFYGSYVGLSTTALGLVLLVTRLTDVLFDFGAGLLSDVTQTAIGRRKPWLIVGALVLGAAFFVQMTPAKGSGVPYFLWGSVAFFLGWSLFNVPYDAWGSELAADYQTRASLFSYRAASGYIGSLMFALIPILPFFHSTDYSPQTLRFIAWTAVGLLLVTVPLALAVAPREARGPIAKPNLRGFASTLRRNRPLQIYIGSAVLNGLSDGVFTALVFIYQANYMGFGKQIWLILVTYIGANFLALPIWSRVVRRIGKHRAWAVGLFLTALCYPPMAFLPPQSSSLIPMLVLVALAGATYSIANVASPAVLGDVVDYETFRTGASKGGAFFAVQGLINKFNVAVGGGIGFLLIAWFGYDPAQATHAPLAVFGIKFAHLCVPSLLKFGAIGLIWRFPLDARGQSIIKRQLDRLAARASA